MSLKYKDKERLILGTIKELAKENKWKFKSYFIHKVINECFCESNFYLSRLEDQINGWASFKPWELDNLFWDVINEQRNKKMPQSFRAEAAFRVHPFKITEFKTNIKNIEEPRTEVETLLLDILKKTNKSVNAVKSIEDYYNLMMVDEKKYTVGIITSLITLGMKEKALEKIFEYRTKEWNSGFMFGQEDYYDLAEKFIKR